MVLLSGGAVLVGVLVIAFVMLSSGDTSVNAAIITPTDTPAKSLWNGRSLGSADAPVKLDVYEDYQCPYCGLFSTKTEPQLVKDFVSAGKVQLTYHDFAFLGPESTDAAVAARCAGEQELFWPYHDYLFSNQRGENKGRFNADFLKQIATKVGVDVDTWSACVASDAPRAAVASDTADGKAKGVNSTPTLIVNGETILGVPAYTDLKAKIDAILAGGSSAPASPSASTP